MQWNPDFLNPSHYSNQNSLTLDFISVNATLDFKNQFLFPLEVQRKMWIPLACEQAVGLGGGGWGRRKRVPSFPPPTPEPESLLTG